MQTTFSIGELVNVKGYGYPMRIISINGDCVQLQVACFFLTTFLDKIEKR